MADGNDLTIDSLQIEIASSSADAEQSIDRLCASLMGLNTPLKKIGSNVGNLRKMITTLSTLQNFKMPDLSQTVGQLERISKIDFSKLQGRALDFNIKVSGANFDSVSQSVKKLCNDLKYAGNGAEATSSFARSLGTLINSINKFDSGSNNFADVTSELVNMLTSLANIPISDNLAKATEGLGNLAIAGNRAGSSLSGLSDSLYSSNIEVKVVEGLLKTVGESFKTFWKLTKKVVSGLKSLAVEIGKLGKALGKFLGAEVNIAVSGLKKLGKEVSGLKEKVPSVDTLHLSLKNLLATVIGFRGITGVFNWAKEALTLGGDITEIDHIIESVFGENMTGYIEEWSRNAIKNFGIAQGAAKQYAGTLNAMFKASNIASDKSSVMAIKMVELAGDLSAFYNIDTADAYQKIQAGLAGMVRPLRSLGLDLSVASLKEYALAQGITKSYTEMTQAEKVMLRYQYLLDATKTQSGDFARTSGKLKTAA